MQELFTKEDRSKFRYWFAHWKAFNRVALDLKIWKLKYLFHDFEKPWMLYYFMLVKGMNHENAYKKVQKWHRHNRKHHLEYKHPNKRDYEAMLIDWECSRFTKTSSPRTALQELEYLNENSKILIPEYNLLIETAHKIGLTE